MDGQVINESFAGLAYPRQSFAIGRSDLKGGDRPGTFLLNLISSMTKDGKLDLGAQVDPGVPHGFAVSAAKGPKPDYRSARYLDDEAELGA